MKAIKKGDQVWIKKAWQDGGDDQFTWIATEDESLGRVGITPLGTGLAIPPWQICPTHMLDRELPARHWNRRICSLLVNMGYQQ